MVGSKTADFVLVHGAWADGTSWQKVIDALEASGAKAVAARTPIRAYWEDASQANRKALRAFLTPETTSWQYMQGVTDRTTVSPDGQNLDNFYLARPGADEIQLDLFGDYKSNVALYPHSSNTSGRTSHRSWRCGARTIRSSFRRALKRSGATFPRRRSTSSIPVTSHWRRTTLKSRERALNAEGIVGPDGNL